MSLVWLITGTSSGMGNDLARTLLQRGEKVIATGHKLAAIEGLKAQGAQILQLDVTAEQDNLDAVAAKAVGLYGRIDVIVNNAGYMEIGSVEESTPEEAFKQFNTNVFGPISVTKAFLPYMRKEKSGTIVWMGSAGGWISTYGAGLYCASKSAVRAVAEAMDEEIKPLGLRSLYMEPGYFRTSFLQEGNRGSYTSRIKDYETLVSQRYEMLASYSGKQPGDPKKLVQLMIDYVKKEGAFKDVGDDYPGGFPVGSDAHDLVKQKLEAQLALMAKWKDVITGTDLPK